MADTCTSHPSSKQGSQIFDSGNPRDWPNHCTSSALLWLSPVGVFAFFVTHWSSLDLNWENRSCTRVLLARRPWVQIPDPNPAKQMLTNPELWPGGKTTILGVLRDCPKAHTCPGPAAALPQDGSSAVARKRGGWGWGPSQRLKCTRCTQAPRHPLGHSAQPLNWNLWCPRGLKPALATGCFECLWVLQLSHNKCQTILVCRAKKKRLCLETPCKTQFLLFRSGLLIKAAYSLATYNLAAREALLVIFIYTIKNCLASCLANTASLGLMLQRLFTLILRSRISIVIFKHSLHLT